MTFFDFFSTEAFLSLWFWALAGLAWSFACHWTAGVPNDLIDRARRGEDAAAADIAALVAIQSRRIAALGLLRSLIAGISGFALAVLGTLGLWFGDPPALALFLLAAPLALAVLFSVRLARRLGQGEMPVDRLLAALRRQRLISQLLAALSLTLICAGSFWQVLVLHGALPAAASPLRALWSLVSG